MYRFKILISNWDSFFFLLPLFGVLACAFADQPTYLLMLLFPFPHFDFGLFVFFGLFKTFPWFLLDSPFFSLTFSNGMNQVYAHKTQIFYVVLENQWWMKEKKHSDSSTPSWTRIYHEMPRFHCFSHGLSTTKRTQAPIRVTVKGLIPKAQSKPECCHPRGSA